MTTTQNAISVSNLYKRFRGGMRSGDVLALADVSLDVSHGEIFGLLGPNGAGKTTLVKILLGSLHPSGGGASINGVDVGRCKARLSVGFLPENHRFPTYLTGRQMLRVFGGMNGMSASILKSRAVELLEIVGMTRWCDTRIKKYSKGMMQRLGMAQALLSDPDLIFLDEPTDGVDPIGRREIRDILVDLKEKGKTIFLNSHLLAEVESICDRVAILDKGKLIKIGPVTGLIDEKPSYRVETAELPLEAAERIKSAFPQAVIKGNGIDVVFFETRHINDMIDLLRSLGVSLVSAAPTKITLEDSFMQLIKGEVKRD